MALAISRPYACPTCRESFTKWGLCQTHVRNSAPCREGIGEKMIGDALQELCRNAANTAVRPSEPDLSTQAAFAAALGNSMDGGGASNASASLTIPGDASLPASFIGDSSPHQGQGTSKQVSGVVSKKLRKATKQGYLTDSEHADVMEKLLELSEHPFAVQNAAVEKFLSLEPGDLRWVVDKGAWLIRCLRFCVRTYSVSPQHDVSSPNSMLMEALAAHAMLPDVLTEPCWDKFSQLVAGEQMQVIGAVRASLATNVVGNFADHFIHICLNEQFIFKLASCPPPRMPTQPAPVEWENIDGTLYHRLLQQFLFRQRNCEEKFFKELADSDPDMHPGDPGSLLHTHKATETARGEGSAEVLSLLHAGAASGLVRACGRLLAEGLDVNESTGVQRTPALHIAAAHGEVGVLRLLLEHQADPRVENGDGCTALYVAVNTAVRLVESDGTSAPATYYSLQIEACNVLILAGAESTKAEALAADHQLYDLRNFMRLNKRLRRLKLRGIADQEAITGLRKLQCETAGFAIAIYEKYLLPQVNTEAAAAEFNTLIASEFIQERDKIQFLGNRLAKKLDLGKKAVDCLRDLPPEAAMFVLENWKIEETVPGIFMSPDHLNALVAQPAKPTSTAGNVGDGIHPGNGDAIGDSTHQNGAYGAAPDYEPPKLLPPGPPKLQGKIRKWDSERGFGFIVQDTRDGSEPNKDIFAHRTNVIGSSPSNHIDLREGSRVTYRLGSQDGRARALDVTMVDSSLNPLPIHLGIRSADADHVDLNNGSDDDGDDEDDLSRKFIRFIRTREVQEVVKEKRAEGEAWLQAVGLRKQRARRDDVIWRAEIDRRIDVLLSKNTTPLQKKDFDFRVRRFLHEFCVHSTVSRVSELLNLVESSTAGKQRDDVRSWPAYMATLLRRFDPKLYESLSDRDRRTRTEIRASKSLGSMGDASSIGDAHTINTETIDEDDAVHSGDNGHDSPPPDYNSPRSSEAASSARSSAASSPRAGATPSPARPPVPQGPPPVANPAAGPGTNLFRFGGAVGTPSTTPASTGGAARSFQ